MNTITIEGHLTEAKLGIVLKEIFCDDNNFVTIIPQYQFRTDNRSFKIDYALIIKRKMFFIEFNGDIHYRETKTEVRDELLRDYAKANDIELIEIPYFVQLNDDTLPYYFSHLLLAEYIKDVKIICDYEHGFRNDKCVLPADFNMMGWDKFAAEYSAFAKADMFYVMRPIYESLMNGWLTSEKVGRSSCHELTPELFIKHYPT